MTSLPGHFCVCGEGRGIQSWFRCQCKTIVPKDAIAHYKAHPELSSFPLRFCVAEYINGRSRRHCPAISAFVGGEWGEWDTVVVQIPMKNCRTKGSDSALQSSSLAKLISIKILGVRVHQGGELTSLTCHILS